MNSRRLRAVGGAGGDATNTRGQRTGVSPWPCLRLPHGYQSISEHKPNTPQLQDQCRRQPACHVHGANGRCYSKLSLSRGGSGPWLEGVVQGQLSRGLGETGSWCHKLRAGNCAWFGVTDDGRKKPPCDQSLSLVRRPLLASYFHQLDIS